MGAKTRSDLAAGDIHEVLSNERRRMTLSILRESKGQSTARALSERIAELETDQTPPPANIRQSAYVSLHQTHLPMLDELGIVEFDRATNAVTLTNRARQVSVYMEAVPRYGISWSEYYVAVSAIGLLLVLATRLGVPAISNVDETTWAALVFLVLVISGAYQTLQQGSSIVNRLLDYSGGD